MKVRLLSTLLTQLVFSAPALAQIDFQGLLQGQQVMLRETRSHEFEARLADLGNGTTRKGTPSYVAGSVPNKEIEWRVGSEDPKQGFQGTDMYYTLNPTFAGLLPDATGRHLSDSPTWEYADDSFNRVTGSFILIPKDQIPDGKWLISAELLFGITPNNYTVTSPDGQHSFQAYGRVDFTFRCVKGFALLPMQTFPHHYHEFTGPSQWNSESMAITALGELKGCKDQGGSVSLEYEFYRFRKLQFNGIQILMTKVQ